MKQRNYMYAALIIVAIVIGVLIFGAGSAGKNNAVADCVKSGRSYNLDTGACVPAGGAPTTTVPSNTNVTGNTVVTAKPSVPVTKPATGGYYSSKVQPTMLPIYPTVISSTTQIQVTSPSSNTAISSPFVITGLARGKWFFEGSFPVILIDAKNKILAQGQATAQNNWMTEDMVPFTTTLTYSRQTTGSKGFLILKKDNPSGLAANDAAVELQVIFQ